jgi:hypothetical protein
MAAFSGSVADRFPAAGGDPASVPRFSAADGFQMADVSAAFEGAGVVIKSGRHG